MSPLTAIHIISIIKIQNEISTLYTVERICQSIAKEEKRDRTPAVVQQYVLKELYHYSAA